jgi:hypothetical protein
MGRHRHSGSNRQVEAVVPLPLLTGGTWDYVMGAYLRCDFALQDEVEVGNSPVKTQDSARR